MEVNVGEAIDGLKQLSDLAGVATEWLRHLDPASSFDIDPSLPLPRPPQDVKYDGTHCLWHPPSPEQVLVLKQFAAASIVLARHLGIGYHAS